MIYPHLKNYQAILSKIPLLLLLYWLVEFLEAENEKLKASQLTRPKEYL